ncbi:MAG: AAA family ATPase [Gammaproteobacteria bacterium]|nr:MAG: AAA family ATPase [Gammaproteobacteria bacterium]
MSRILAIANQKGGVGKTTTCVNLGASLAATRRRVLIVDLDPQGNATMGCGVNKNELDASSCDVLLGESLIEETIVALDNGMWLLPGNNDLVAAEVGLLQAEDRERRLRQVLELVRNDFDFILIDCPPSLNMLTINALSAADGVIIPMQCEYYALEGLSSLLETIERVRATVNPRLQVEGLLRTMFDPRNNLANQVAAQLTDHFGDRVYNSVIPRNVRLAEAPSHGLSALQYDKNSRGAVAYLTLAGEIIRRQKKQNAANANQ